MRARDLAVEYETVSVDSNAAANLVTLRLVGSGMATVTVTLGGLSAGIDFDVTIP